MYLLASFTSPLVRGLSGLLTDEVSVRLTTMSELTEGSVPRAHLCFLSAGLPATEAGPVQAPTETVHSSSYVPAILSAFASCAWLFCGLAHKHYILLCLRENLTPLSLRSKLFLPGNVPCSAASSVCN